MTLSGVNFFSMDVTKAERSTRILLYLLGNRGKGVTVREVLAHLGLDELERQSVQRDLRLLASMSQTAIVASGTGRNLQYRIPRARGASNFRPLQKDDLFTYLLLSRARQGMLRDGASGLNLFDDLLDHAMRIAGPVQETSDLYRDLQSRFDDLVWFSGEEIVQGPKPELIPILFQGLLEKRKLQVEYEGNNHELPQTRVLEPWKLLVYRGELYFLCPNPHPKGKGQILTYKLVRMLKAKLLNEKFEIDKAAIERHRKTIQNSGGLLGGDGPQPKKIRLKFNWECRKILQERKFHATQKSVNHSGKGKKPPEVLVTLEAPIDEDLLNWIRRWGTAVQVLQPPVLKKAMLEYAVFLNQTYRSKK